MGQFYHFCLSSGNEVMFRCEQDFNWAFNCYALALYKTGSVGLADAIMTNHLHGCAVSNDIKGLIYHYRAGYSRYFNRKYFRRGSLGEREPFTIDVVGAYHRLAALSYTMRNPLHHGVAPTPFAYGFSSANAIFRKELGKEENTDLLERKFFARHLPDRAEVPLGYKMNSSGLLLRESVLDVAQVEYFYNTPRNFLFYMNRLSGEEWEREQRNESSDVVTLNCMEPGSSEQSLSIMRRCEFGRENYALPSDMLLCEYIDNEILPLYGVLSVYQLTERQKQEIGNNLYKKFRVASRQISRCLCM